MIALRPYTPDDAPALLALFQDTIRRVNARDYGPDQIAAWIAVDQGAWTARFEAPGRYVVVAECADALAGFAELEPDGHIDRFYVSADHQGRGVGRALMEAVVDEARRRGIARLFSEVSITARPFFERSGFVVVTPQTVTVRGVEFVNYRMSLAITSS